MVMQRADFADGMAPGLRKLFINKFGDKPLQYPELFNVNTSKRQYEDDSYVAGFGFLADKSEGDASTYDDAIQGFDKRYTHITRSLAYRISQEMVEDELYGTIAKFPKALAKSTRSTIETNAADIYNNAFTSGTGGDGSYLGVTTHALVGGGTQKNILTSAADLSSTSLEQALIDIRATTDDRGLLLNLMPKKLIVAPSNEWTAMKLLQSVQTPEDANNSINPAARQGLKLVVNDYLTDSDAWFILCDEHELNFFWRVMPDHMKGNDFDTDDAKFKVRARWSNGWSLPWGWFGTPGA